jgi:transcriptional regulator with XRE-family HTH domain
MSVLQLAPSRRLPALPSKLRTLMAQAVSDSGYTHAAIARRAGLDRSTVSNVLNGRRAGTVDTWDLILTAADVELVAVLS